MNSKIALSIVAGFLAIVAAGGLAIGCNESDSGGTAAPRSRTEPAAKSGPGLTPTALPSADCREERVDRETSGGETAGYLFLPGGEAKKPHAAVVIMHGGFADDPEKADRVARQVGLSYSSHLCPLGFGVFSVDYRWSAFGMGEMEDVAGAFDYLVTRPEIDKNRIAAMGPSHGGYMAVMAVTSPEHKRPFAVAVDLYGFVDVADLVASGREQDNPQAKLTIQQLGNPGSNPGAYRAISPRYHIGSLDTPLLIVVGTEDQFLDQLRAFRADLKKAGKDYEYHEVAGARHGFDTNQEPYTTALWNYVTAFLQDRLK